MNRLLPLGKEKVLALLAEYMRLCYLGLSEYVVGADTPYPLFHLGAALFQPSRSPDSDSPMIWIQDDVPVWYEFRGGIGGRLGQLTAEELDFYREKARFRTGPLVPTDRPMEILDRLQVSTRNPDEQKQLQEPAVREGIMEHLLRLVETVYRPERDRRGNVVRGEQDVEAWWRSVMADVAKLNIRWDSRKGEYAFADGTQLPPLPPTSTVPHTLPG